MTCIAVQNFLVAPLCLLLGAAAAANAADATSVSAAGITLRSVSVSLPTGNRAFAGGAEADAINRNCVACHSTDMVLNQPNLPAPVWQSEVDKMRNAYKAPVAAEDVPLIVAYLMGAKGAK
jgi:mono/diheme cytochrome c family protein